MADDSVLSRKGILVFDLADSMTCQTCELEGTVECDKHCQDVVKESAFQKWCGVIIGIILSSLFAYLWLIAAVIDYLVEHGGKNDKG